MPSWFRQDNRTSGLAIALLIAFEPCLACEGAWVTLGRIPAADSGGVGSTSASDGGRSNAGASGSSGGGASSVPSDASAGAAGEVSQVTSTAPEFIDVMRVSSLVSTYADDNPTLTADRRELYFTSKNRPGGKGNVDVWVAKRPDTTSDFQPPLPVLAVNTDAVESSPAISADGLTIWLGAEPASGGLGGYDILRATRATRDDDFGSPSIVTELSSGQDDIPRPLGNHQLTMPLGSRRGGSLYLTYFATRANTDAGFGQPVLRDELIVEGANVSDAFLTDDGLWLYFARAVDGLSDLFVAHRLSVDSPFDPAIPLLTINTPNDDRDPWLSADGAILYFSSDRDNPGTLNIYQARLAAASTGASSP